MSNLSDKIELQTGVPVTAVFAFDQGKLCSKRWPGAEDCYARQTKDGRVLFVDAAEEMRLRKTVRAGQPVILCREETKAGAKYLTIKTPAPELKQPLGVVNGKHSLPESKFADVSLRNAEPSAAQSTEQAHTNGHVATESQTLITRCMIAAVDAAAKATAHGQEIGFPVTLGAPEIERIAVTLYINSMDTYGRPNGQAPRSHYNGRA